MTLRKRRPFAAAVAAFVAASALLLRTGAWAAPSSLSEDLVRELISESVPTAFEVAPFFELDFQLRWDGRAPDGVRVELVPGSLTWVRVSRHLVLPRARVRVSSSQDRSVAVRVGGAVQSIAPGGGEAPVSLFSGDQELSVRRAGVLSRHRFLFSFSPAGSSQASRLRSRIFVDSSCSSQRLEVTSEKLKSGQWAYVGCRLVHSRSEGATVPQLELFIAWSGAVSPVSLSGIPQTFHSEPGGVLITTLLSFETSRARLEEPGGGAFELSASLAPSLKKAFLGLGLGPYSYSLQVPGLESVARTSPITTLYGSYFLSEGSRVVFFDAFAVHRRWYNDFGLYFNNESTRALDERLSINILLGLHLISFVSPIGIQHRLGAPQGFEMIYRDALGRRNNLSVGGFFYPPIAGKSYYNTWFRVGTSRFFGEINYLSWTELSGDGGQASSRSLGISVGAPLIFL